MAELMFIPLALAALLLTVSNPNSSCKYLIDNRYDICKNNNNKNDCFKPLNSYLKEDSEKITKECVSKNNNNYFLKGPNFEVYVTGKRESMTPSDAMNQAIRKCTEKSVSGVGVDGGSLYYVCVRKE
jgi:hypothetical protein